MDSFFEIFENWLTQRDDNSAAFEFDSIDEVMNFLDMLNCDYSDYSIRVCRTSGHPTVQVFMRLEEGLWKAK